MSTSQLGAVVRGTPARRHHAREVDDKPSRQVRESAGGNSFTRLVEHLPGFDGDFHIGGLQGFGFASLFAIADFSCSHNRPGGAAEDQEGAQLVADLPPHPIPARDKHPVYVGLSLAQLQIDSH
jgi:hypothetical protein